MKVEYWIDGMFLAAPLEKTPIHEFWSSYEPLPTELKSEKTMWRTNADLFYTLEFQGNWTESSIATTIRSISELESGHFFSYFRIIPSMIEGIAPPDFTDRKARFMKFTDSMDFGKQDFPSCYPLDYNGELKRYYREYLRDPSKVPTPLLQHDLNVIADALRRMEQVHGDMKLVTA